MQNSAHVWSCVNGQSFAKKPAVSDRDVVKGEVSLLEEAGFSHTQSQTPLTDFLRARSHEHIFFGKDQLSQKLWQTICVHTYQRKKWLKKLCQRIFVNVFSLHK